ncbi:hypothetical protein Tco_0981587, partial [Tanacetum coccineum]
MTLAQHREAIRGIQEHLLRVRIHEELTALRNRVDIAEAENASLRATIRTIEAIETVTHNHEGLARPRGIQESQGVRNESVRTSLIDILLHDLCTSLYW